MILQTSQHSKIYDYLKKRAPYSVLDQGIEYAGSGAVSECSLAGGRIQGSVKDKQGVSHSVCLEILSSSELEAACTCSTVDELREQWCSHAVALLWHAYDLEFFDPSGGFTTPESKFRLNTSSAEEIAAVINEVGKNPPLSVPDKLYLPEVSV
ncbi:MAG: hypothetical protein GX589_08400, partial [Deltaproteobacteria bacterium]|nr:hypothetical protein [Deltaproteobacteria bacterium]